MVKCIRKLCTMYIEKSGVLLPSGTCKLNPTKNIKDECIGIESIPNVMEDITCRIATLVTQYNSLEKLEEYIDDNQIG